MLSQRSRQVTPHPHAAYIGLREDQLDLRERHFGPLRWITGRAPQHWLAALRRDLPRRVFALSEARGEWFVCEVLTFDQAAQPHDRPLKLKYYSKQSGFPSAVCLLTEAAVEHAAD